MRFSRAVLLVMLFILVFDGVDGKKGYKYYNLTFGPKNHEIGKYLFKPSIGDPKYCRYCPVKVLRNSNYSDKQQLLCIKKYKGKELTDELLPQEFANIEFPLCDVGKVPGCGPPPDVNKTKNHVWVCDPGYSLTPYSVYFSCALVCNVSDKVDWLYYCNETLQWEVERPTNWQKCEAPVTAEDRDNLITIMIAVGSLLFLVVILVVTCITCRWYRKKYRANADQKNNQNNKGGQGIIIQQGNKAVQENGNVTYIDETNRPAMIVQVKVQAVYDSSCKSSGSVSTGSQTSDRSSNLGASQSDERPLIRRAAAPVSSIEDVGTSDIGSRSDENEEDTETSRLLPHDASGDEGAVGGYLDGDEPPRVENRCDDSYPSGEEPPKVENRCNDNSLPQVKPSVKILQRKGDKKMTSIPLQGDIYSIEKGTYFQVVPNSPGGIEVRRFRIERKDDKRPLEWVKYISSYYVDLASEQDAGYYMWKMILDNNEEYSGCFEITISSPLPVKPSVSIIQIHENKMKAIVPLQGNKYSLVIGSDFKVLANSNRGYCIKTFIIDKKDNNKSSDRPNYFNVKDASLDDSGLYAWEMLLDNNEKYTGSYTINIFLPVRPSTYGKEAITERITTAQPDGKEALTEGTITTQPDGKKALTDTTTQPDTTQQQQQSSVIHLDIESLMGKPDPNESIIPEVQQHPLDVRGEMVRESNSHNPLRNAAPLSSEMFNLTPQDSGLESSNGPGIDRSNEQASNRAIVQRQNPSVTNRNDDIRYSTSGYQSQASAILAMERFGENFDNVSNLDIKSFIKPDRVDDSSRMSSARSDLVQNLLRYQNPSQDVEGMDTNVRSTSNPARNVSPTEHRTNSSSTTDPARNVSPMEHRTNVLARPDPTGNVSSLDDRPSALTRQDPAGNVSPMYYTENDDPLDQTKRKEVYVANGIQQLLPRQHQEDEHVYDADCTSDRLDSVVLERDILVNNPVFEEDVEINENTYLRAEIQELSYRHGAGDDLEHHIDDITDINDDDDETKL